MAEKHGAAEEESGRVGLVLALDIETDVSAAGLEDGNVAAHVAAGNDTGTTDESSSNVGEDTAVEVGHDHDVELLGTADALHRGVVYNHVVALELRIILGEPVEGAAEETVGKLHDVGLVDAGDLLAAVHESKLKGELGNALRLGAGDDLEGLNDAGHALVLETAVLALGVLADDAEVNVVVASLEAGDVLDEGNGGIDVELLAEGDVEALVARPADGGVKDTLETELVAAERGDSLLEGLLGAPGGAAVAEAGNLDLLPGDGDVVGLEDGLDALGNLGTDTVTWDEGDGVFAAVLGRLEDVGLDRVLDAGEAARNVEALGGESGGPEKALLEKKMSVTIVLQPSYLRFETFSCWARRWGIGHWEVVERVRVRRVCCKEGDWMHTCAERAELRESIVLVWVGGIKNEGIATARRAAAARGRRVEGDSRLFLDEKSKPKRANAAKQKSTKCPLAHRCWSELFFYVSILPNLWGLAGRPSKR